MSLARRLPFLAGVLLGAIPARSAPAVPWWEGIAGDAAATASWIENASRTSSEPTRKDAATYELELGATVHRQLAPAWLAGVTVEAGYLDIPKFDLNNAVTATAKLQLQRKFGLGPMAPVLQLEGTGGYKAARLDADRGWTAAGTIKLAKRLVPSLRVAATGTWLEHHARSATFDLQQRLLGGEASWDITGRWRLGGTAQWLDGRVVANAAPAIWSKAIGGALGPEVFTYYNSIPWEVTQAWGPNWVSYNVEATADLWTLTLGYALTDRATVELRAGSAFVVNEIGITYPTDSWSLRFAYRF